MAADACLSENYAGHTPLTAPKPTLTDVSETRQARFERLMADAYPRALGAAIKKYRSYGIDPYDIVQAGALKAWKNFDAFEPGTNFPAWFFTIVHRGFLNEYKRRKRYAEVRAESPEHIARKTFGSNLESQKTWLDRESPFSDEILVALEELPPGFKVILLKRIFEEKSYKELSYELDMPIGTVMSQLSRARAHLRVLLEDFER